MKIHPEQIGFDIDGVVADTMEAFIRIADRDHSLKLRPEEITDFMVEDCLDISPEIIDEIFDRLLCDPVGAELKPMPECLPILEEMATRSSLTFITARPELEPIGTWLEKHLSMKAFAGSCLIATGDHDDKLQYIRKMGLKYFVDDRHLTCNRLALEKDIIPIVFSQPWNRGKHILHSVENWKTIGEYCIHP